MSSKSRVSREYTEGLENFAKRIYVGPLMHISYVVYTMILNNLYVLSNKAVGPGKNPKYINVGPTSIPESI